MLTMARDYARTKGFTGTFLIEPKPMEPEPAAVSGKQELYEAIVNMYA